MASIKNIVIVAISQVGVIVFGVLAAGIFHKESSLMDVLMPWSVATLYRYGFLGLSVPLAWSIGAVVLQLRANGSDDIRTLMFWIGVLVLIALAIFCLYADVSPWLNIARPLPDNGDDAGQ
jgi:ABC-type microcin C transport system permease subunit YejE